MLWRVCTTLVLFSLQLAFASNPVILLHLHKGGGTTICSIAKNNRIPTPIPGKTRQDGASFMSKNCNPSWKAKEDAWTDNGANGVVEFLRQSGVGFYAIEAPIRARYAFPALRDIPNNILLVSLVREPRSLMMSLCGVPDLMPDSKSSKCYEEMSNAQIRTYIGCEAKSDYATCGNAMHPALTHSNAASSVALAIEYIANTTVLVTHRFSEASYILRHKLGWKYTNTTLYRSGTHKTYPTLSPAQVQYINASIQFDQVLCCDRPTRMINHIS